MVIILKQIYELKTFRSNFNLYLSLFIVSLPLLRPKKCVRILAVKIFQIVRKLSTSLFLSLFLLFFLSFFLSSFFFLSFFLSLSLSLAPLKLSSYYLFEQKSSFSRVDIFNGKNCYFVRERPSTDYNSKVWLTREGLFTSSTYLCRKKSLSLI